MSLRDVRNLLYAMQPAEARPPWGGGDFSVLVVIAFHIHPDKGFAWPSIPTIARHTGFTLKAVMRHIKALETRGLITIERGGKGRQRFNRYWLTENVPKSTPMSHEENVPKSTPIKNTRNGSIETTNVPSQPGNVPKSTTETGRNGHTNLYVRGIEKVEKGDSVAPRLDCQQHDTLNPRVVNQAIRDLLLQRPFDSEADLLTAVLERFPDARDCPPADERGYATLSFLKSRVQFMWSGVKAGVVPVAQKTTQSADFALPAAGASR